MKKHLKILIPLAIFIAAIAAGILDSNKSSEFPLVASLNTNRTEEQTKEVKTPESKPVFLSGSIEPMKVAPGDEVTVTVEIKDDYGIEKVMADMGGIETIELKLKEGDEKQGIWQGIWIAYDTEPRNYQTMILAINVLGKQATMSINWEDPTITDSFTDETMIGSTTNLTVDTGAGTVEVELSCDGWEYGGYCWYQGTLGQNCTDVCLEHGSSRCVLQGLLDYYNDQTCTICTELGEQTHPGCGAWGSAAGFALYCEAADCEAWSQCQYGTVPSTCEASHAWGKRMCSCSGGYYSSGTLTSTNLLSGEVVSSIDSFFASTTQPAATALWAQFSQDNSSWYSAEGELGATTTISTSTPITDLSGLKWSGPNFYYKMYFSSDGTDTPILDEISVDFTSWIPRPPGISPSGGGFMTF